MANSPEIKIGYLWPRREEWVLSSTLVGSVIACYASGTGSAFWSLLRQYVTAFGLEVPILFIATRFFYRAERVGIQLSRYRCAEGIARVDHELARGGLWFFAALAAYTNMKVRIPLLHSLVVDPVLEDMDRPFGAWLSTHLAGWVQQSALLDGLLSAIYLNDFLFLSLALLLLHMHADSIGLRITLLSSALLFMFAIWVAVLLPSYGPFVMHPEQWHWVKSRPMGGFQLSLLRSFVGVFATSSHATVVDARAGAGISAFPSLHTAQLTLVFFVCRAHEQLKWLAWITLVGLLATMAATLAYGWHYFAALLGGIALAYATFAWVTKLAQHPRHVAEPAEPTSELMP